MVHWMKEKLYARDVKVISLDKIICFLSLFQDRRTAIVAYRRAVLIGSKESFMQKIKVMR